MMDENPIASGDLAKLWLHSQIDPKTGEPLPGEIPFATAVHWKILARPLGKGSRDNFFTGTRDCPERPV